MKGGMGEREREKGRERVVGTYKTKSAMRSLHGTHSPSRNVH